MASGRTSSVVLNLRQQQGSNRTLWVATDGFGSHGSSSCSSPRTESAYRCVARRCYLIGSAATCIPAARRVGLIGPTVVFILSRRGAYIGVLSLTSSQATDLVLPVGQVDDPFAIHYWIASIDNPQCVEFIWVPHPSVAGDPVDGDGLIYWLADCTPFPESVSSNGAVVKRVPPPFCMQISITNVLVTGILPLVLRFQL